MCGHVYFSIGDTLSFFLDRKDNFWTKLLAIKSGYSIILTINNYYLFYYYHYYYQLLSMGEITPEVTIKFEIHSGKVL